MLTLRQLTLARGNKVLFAKVNICLNAKQKIGIIGHNGCGKTSLFKLILGELTADSGDCVLNPQLRLSHLSQQLPDSSQSALDFVLAGDEEYLLLQQQLQQAEQAGNDLAIIACHEHLKQTEGYSKPAKAATILAGLGFSSVEQQQAVNHFSGGWRMRLSLARCLMKPADLLLLDEPTNHLDMEAIFWLEKWLKQSPASVLLISHDREFLDAIVTHILHLERQTIMLYSGNYTGFEQTRAQQLAVQQAMHEKQQQKINHMMAFVNRFKAKATKAKQAQSRLRALAKMDIIAQAHSDSPFSFNFYPCPKAGKPLIYCDQLSAGYQQHRPILSQLKLSINPGDRIALLGPNGEGKSTLIKTLIGHLTPLSGHIQRTQHLQIGYYAQHQLEALDPNLSPIATLQALSPTVREQTIRDFLGGFNFIGDMASHAICHFSGGEKARLALAKLVWRRPNLLLLDEPTNHLDLGMRAAIEIALQSYEGALILISHDRHLLNTTVNDFYLVYQQQVSPFAGNLDDYQQWLFSRENNRAMNEVPRNNNYREKKLLQNRSKKLEQMIIQYQQNLSQVETTLADLTLYEPQHQDRLQQVLTQQKTYQQQLDTAEEEWLNVISAIDALA